MKKLIIKIGSSTIIDKNSKDFFNEKIITNLFLSIKELQKSYQIYVVSSGAIALGKLINKSSLNIEASHFSMFNLGWAFLTKKYYDICEKIKLYPMLRILTKENLSQTIEYIKEYNENFLSIFNEDDFLNREDPFFDNDEITFEISKLIKPDIVIFLTSIDGVLTKEGGELIKKLDISSEFNPFDKTQTGRGGIQSKVNFANNILLCGAKVFIANGLKHNILIDAINEKGNYTEICKVK